MQDQNKDSLKAAFEEELQKLEAESILSPEYKRKKTIIWLVRTILAIALFVIFWDDRLMRSNIDPADQFKKGAEAPAEARRIIEISPFKFVRKALLLKS